MQSKINPSNPKIAGLIYAGGRGQRMGGVDKAFVAPKGKPQIAVMTSALQEFVEHIYIARQSDQADLSEYGEVLIDPEADQGPYAGLTHGIERAFEDGFQYLLTVAIDGQSLPENYLIALQNVAKPHAMVQIHDRLQPTYALYDLKYKDDIIAPYLKGERALRAWVCAECCGFALFSDDGFANINQL